MQLQNVTADNFLSYEHFELPLNDQGLILIQGHNSSAGTFESNGSGKTSLVSAITYAFFGITLNGQKGNDVINRQTGKGCAVKLTFTDNDTNYRIERYRKDKVNHNKVRVYANGDEITEPSSKQTDELITKLVGVDFDTYVNSIVYSNVFASSSFMQMTDSGKKAILDTLAHTQVYGDAKEKAKTLAKEADQDHQATELKLTNVKAELAATKTNYQAALAEYQHSKDKVDELKSQLANAEQLYQTTKVKTDNESITLNEQLSKYQGQFNQYTKQMDLYNRYQAKVMELTNKGKQANLTLKKASDEYTEKVNQLATFQQSPTCPYCGANLDNDHYQVELNKHKLGVIDLKNAYDNDKQFLVYLRVEYAKVVAHKQVQPSGLDTLQQNINQVKDRLNQNNNEVKETYNRVQTFKQALQALNLTPPVYDQAKADKLVAQQDQLATKLDTLMTRYDHMNVLVKDVFSDSGVKSYLMDMITPFLNEHANAYLNTLSSGTIQIEISTQTETKSGELRDKMDVKVTNASGAADYLGCSAGERKRIDLAIAFAIQDLVLSQSDLTTNVAIYDECFDGLDGIGCEQVVEVLKQKRSQLGTVFVISHNENLKPLFDKVITVWKNQEGISEVSDEN